MTAGEYAFYKARSGLPAGATLQDHRMAYFKANSGLGAGTLADHMMAFYKAQSGLGVGTLSDHMRKYFQVKMASTSPNLHALRTAFFANPPVP